MNIGIKKMAAVLLACVLVFALAACGGGDSGGSSSGGSIGGDATQSGRSDIIIQIQGEPSSLDPQGSVEVMSFIVLGQVNATLIKRGPNGFEPYIAESYSTNEDSSSYHFILRDDVYFHNGAKLTAEDVAFTMERGKNHEFQPPFFDLVDSVEVIAENECIIHLVRPYSPFESVLTSVQFPILSKKADEDGVDFTREPIGAGPYMFDTWNTADSIELVANPDFFLGEAPIKDVSLKFMGDANTAYAALESGDLDFAYTLPPTAFDEMNSGTAINTMEFVDSAWMLISLNHTLPEFKDRNVRLAMNHALNRDDMVLVALEGRGFVSCIPAYDGLTGYIPGYEPYAYDMDLAKEYLANSAFPDGFDFSIKCYDAKTQKVAEMAQTNLRELGINLAIEFMDIGTAVGDLVSGNYEVGMITVANAVGDVDALKDLFSNDATLNLAQQDGTAIYDKFIEAAAKSGDDRLAILGEAYDLMMEEGIYLPIFFGTNFYGATAALDVSEVVIDTTGIAEVYKMKWN